METDLARRDFEHSAQEPTGEIGRPAHVRDQAIDLLRWLATVGVIIQHSAFASRYSSATLAQLSVLRHVFGWCVLFFFTAAGYVTRTDVPWRGQARRRALRLLPPYIAVSMVSFFVFTLSRKLHLTSASDGLGPKALAVRLATLQGFGPQLYFLPYLLVISLGVLAFMHFLGLRRTLIVLGAFAALQWCLVGFPAGSIGPQLDRVLLYALAYAGGIAMNPAAGWRPRDIALLSSTATLGGLLFACFGFNTEPLIQLTVPFWLWWLFRRWAFLQRWRNVRQASGTGAVYLWHEPVLLPGFTVLLGRIGLANLLNFAVASLLTVLACLAIDRAARVVRLARLLTL